MEDMERYGDYNEQEEEAVPAQKNVVLTCIKYLLILVIVAVIALLGCRLFLFDYYPKAAKQLVMTESLRAYYDRTDGDVRIQTQDLRFRMTILISLRSTATILVPSLPITCT